MKNTLLNNVRERLAHKTDIIYGSYRKRYGFIDS